MGLKSRAQKYFRPCDRLYRIKILSLGPSISASRGLGKVHHWHSQIKLRLNLCEFLLIWDYLRRKRTLQSHVHPIISGLSIQQLRTLHFYQIWAKAWSPKVALISAIILLTVHIKKLLLFHCPSSRCVFFFERAVEVAALDFLHSMKGNFINFRFKLLLAKKYSLLPCIHVFHDESRRTGQELEIPSLDWGDERALTMLKFSRSKREAAEIIALPDALSMVYLISWILFFEILSANSAGKMLVHLFFNRYPESPAPSESAQSKSWQYMATFSSTFLWIVNLTPFYICFPTNLQKHLLVSVAFQLRALGMFLFISHLNSFNIFLLLICFT